MGIVPGSSVLISIVPEVQEEEGDAPEREEETPVDGASPPMRRFWPAVVESINVSPNPIATRAEASLCEIEFTDSVSYNAFKPIWGVFVDKSPAEILGGALSLAAGGSGEPTTTPTLPGLPITRIYESLRTDLTNIPYAIATGEKLQDWLEYVFGQLGVRYEMVGDASGLTGVRLKDLPPAGRTLVLRITEGRSLDHEHARLGTMRILSSSSERGALLDNPATGDFRRLRTDAGSLETVISSALTSPEEAETRSKFSNERVDAESFQTVIHTTQSGLLPGRIIKLVDQNNQRPTYWQTTATTHTFRLAVYRCRATVISTDNVWRPPVPINPGRSLVVSGAVDDSESGAGGMVARDRQNRIPVRLSFAQQPQPPTETDGTDESDAGNEATASAPPIVMLPALEQMAGHSHGFFASHRQGDICRIAVRTPFFAEIIGAEYRDNLRVGRDVVDSSAGVVVQHGDTEWSGLLFRPRSDVFDEDEDEDDNDDNDDNDNDDEDEDQNEERQDD